MSEGKPDRVRPPHRMPPPRPSPAADLSSGGVLVVIAAIYGVAAGGYATPGDAGPALLPTALAVALALLGATIVVSAWRRRGAEAMSGFTRIGERKAWVAIALTALYAVLFQPVGFAVTTLAFTAAVAALFGAGRWALLLLPPVATLVLYTFFRIALGVRLPAGLL